MEKLFNPNRMKKTAAPAGKPAVSRPFGGKPMGGGKGPSKPGFLASLRGAAKGAVAK